MNSRCCERQFSNVERRERSLECTIRSKVDVNVTDERHRVYIFTFLSRVITMFLSSAFWELLYNIGGQV